MIMKKIILMVVCLITLFSIFRGEKAKADNIGQTSTITDATINVSCYCGSVYGKGCKADNKGASCNPSNNFKCWEYDRNCS